MSRREEDTAQPTDDQSTETGQALTQLRALFGGLFPNVASIVAMRTLYLTWSERLQFQPNAVGSAITRYTDAQLIPALLGICRVQESRERRFAQIPFDVARARLLGTYIGLCRDLYDTTTRFTDRLAGHLALLEDDAHELVKGFYDLVRPLAQAGSSVSDDLEAAEKHLYEAAQTGAQTRARKESERLALAEEADRKATERVSREVVSATVDRILDLAKSADTRTPPR